LSEITDVVFDETGAVYLTGSISGDADLDPGPGTDLQESYFEAPFLMALDAAGDYQWGHLFSSTSNTGGYGRALGRDAAGRLYMAGSYYTTGIVLNTFDFDPGPGDTAAMTDGSTYGYLAKYDANGNFLNLYDIGGTASADVRALSVDDDGNALLAGEFTETVDFDPTVATASRSSAGAEDAFVLSVTSDDKFDWVHTYGGSDTDDAHRLVRGPEGEILVGGSYRGSVDFSLDPPAALSTAPANPSQYLLRMAPNGAFGYVKSIGVSTPTYALRVGSVAFKPNRQIEWAAYSQNSSDLDPGPGTQDTAVINCAFMVTLQETVSPQVRSITRVGGNPTGSSLVDFQVSFDQPVNDVDESDFVLHTTGGIGGAYVYTVGGTLDAPIVTVFTGTGNGTIRLDLLDDDTIIEPTLGFPLGGTGAGNGSFTSGETFMIDKTRPGVTLSSAAPPAVNTPISVTAQLSVGATDFAAVDVDPINATVSDFAGAGDTYTFTLTPLAQGAFGAEVGASGFTDGIANQNTASNLLTRTYDSIPPEISGLVANPAEAYADEVVTLTFSVSEALSLAPVVSVNGETAIPGTGNKTGTDFTFTYTVTGQDPAGPATIEILATDTAGNLGALQDADALTILAPVVPMPLSGAYGVSILLGLAAANRLRRKRMSRTSDRSRYDD
jgi:hypothetical protein